MEDIRFVNEYFKGDFKGFRERIYVIRTYISAKKIPNDSWQQDGWRNKTMENLKKTLKKRSL